MTHLCGCLCHFDSQQSPPEFLVMYTERWCEVAKGQVYTNQVTCHYYCNYYCNSYYFLFLFIISALFKIIIHFSSVFLIYHISVFTPLQILTLLFSLAASIQHIQNIYLVLLSTNQSLHFITLSLFNITCITNYFVFMSSLSVDITSV